MRPVVQEVALDYARQRVARMRAEPIDLDGKQVRILDERDSESFAVFVFARLLYAGRIDPDFAAKQANEGDPLFQHALEHLAAIEMKGEIQLLEPLRSHVISALEHPPKLRTLMRRRETNYFRDIAITMLVQELCEGFDIKATTSAKGGKEASACGIAATALGLSYDTVAKVWTRLGKQI